MKNLGKDIEIGDFYYNILNYLSDEDARPKSLLEVNSSPFQITDDIVEKINSTTLTKEAVSFIFNNDNAEPSPVKLIDTIIIKNSDKYYHITDKGLKYLEYIQYADV